MTTQRYLPQPERHLYVRAAAPAVAPNADLFTQAFALVPGQDVIYPKAWVFSGFVAGRLARQPQLHAELRPPLRRRARASDIPDWPAPTDKNNLDPRVGFNWDPLGDQKWSVHGGVGRFTQQNPIFTIVKGAVLRPQRHRDARAAAERPGVPEVSEHAARRSRRARCCRRATSRRFRPIWRTSSRGRTASASQRQLGSRTSASVDVNMNRSHKHGFLDTNYPTPIPKA